jgi:hypothetical protein
MHRNTYNGNEPLNSGGRTDSRMHIETTQTRQLDGVAERRMTADGWATAN